MCIRIKLNQNQFIYQGIHAIELIMLLLLLLLLLLLSVVVMMIRIEGGCGHVMMRTAEVAMMLMVTGEMLIELLIGLCWIREYAVGHGGHCGRHLCSR
jgi:hypothetical protein